MKIRNLFFTAALASLALTACSSDDECTGYNGKNDQYVQFAGTIGEQMTKAAGTSWDSGDAIGVYMKASGADLGTATDLNVRYTTTGDGVFKAATQGIELPADGSKVDFVAYYPQQATINDFKYPINVADQSSLPNIDLLYSNNAVDADKNNAIVQMNFKHMLSQLILNITAGDGITSLSGLSLSMADGITDGTFDLKSGTTTIGTTKATIAPTVNIATNATVNAILVPGQDLATTKLTFTLDGRTYVWTPDAQMLESGKKYTYNIRITLTDLAILNPNATIEDWVEGNTGGDITLKPSEDPAFVVDKPTVAFDETTTSSVVKLTAPATEPWTATASETWLTVSPASGTGSGDITITAAQENTTGADRTATVTIASSSTTKAAGIEPITITVTQKAKSQGVETEFFKETMDQIIASAKPKINAVSGWDNTSVSYSDEYGATDIRALSSTNPNSTPHLWLPANKDASLKISNINADGYSNIKLLVDVAANVFNAGTQFDTKKIQVTFDGTTFTLPSKILSKDNDDANIFYPLEIDLASITGTSTSELLIFIPSSDNSVGVRIDNIIIKGTK